MFSFTIQIMELNIRVFVLYRKLSHGPMKSFETILIVVRVSYPDFDWLTIIIE